ncbi:MAG TPA: hypothetical protein VHM88_08300 [Candidatus Acidoferrales bacterium]|jgi:hypothetical protein|nr:hypothetical protein [Candidatus Acidoferrales bacterium]
MAAGTFGVVTILTVAGLFSANARAQENSVVLSAGAGAPLASGAATIMLRQGVAEGTIEVNGLPPQPFASGHFYGVWFVRADGSKAFLGALISKKSIIFSDGGNGHMQFAATQFTAGPAAGSPIAFGAAGTNVIVVLIESMINGFTPSPVGPVPGTGIAVIGTF